MSRSEWIPTLAGPSDYIRKLPDGALVGGVQSETKNEKKRQSMKKDRTPSMGIALKEAGVAGWVVWWVGERPSKKVLCLVSV